MLTSLIGPTARQFACCWKTAGPLALKNRSGAPIPRPSAWARQTNGPLGRGKRKMPIEPRQTNNSPLGRGKRKMPRLNRGKRIIPFGPRQMLTSLTKAYVAEFAKNFDFSWEIDHFRKSWRLPLRLSLRHSGRGKRKMQVEPYTFFKEIGKTVYKNKGELGEPCGSPGSRGQSNYVLRPLHADEK